MSWFRAARRLRAFRSASLAVVLAACVGACHTLPPGTFDRTLKGSTIEGRMSVRYKDLATGKEDTSPGRFVWSVDGPALELSLLDPLGQTVALVRSDARHASIVFRDGRRFTGDTPEALTQETLGWTVPLRGLRDWLDGRTGSGSPVTRLDDGRLRQDGWTLRFQRDEGAPADAPPKRIDLYFPGPPAEVELRLVVDQRSGP